MWGHVAGQLLVKALCWLLSQVLQLHLVMQQVCFLTQDPVCQCSCSLDLRSASSCFWELMEMKRCATGAGIMRGTTGGARLLLRVYRGARFGILLSKALWRAGAHGRHSLLCSWRVFSKHLILSCSRSWESLALSSGKAVFARATQLISSLGSGEGKRKLLPFSLGSSRGRWGCSCSFLCTAVACRTWQGICTLLWS